MSNKKLETKKILRTNPNYTKNKIFGNNPKKNNGNKKLEIKNKLKINNLKDFE